MVVWMGEDWWQNLLSPQDDINFFFDYTEKQMHVTGPDYCLLFFVVQHLLLVYILC